MFYDRFTDLCSKKGIAPSRAAIEAGISKSLVTKWKANMVEYPSADVAKKLAKYFGITVADLLGEETENPPTVEGERVVSDDEILMRDKMVSMLSRLSREQKQFLIDQMEVMLRREK